MFLQIIVIFFSLYGIDAIGLFINSMSYTDTHFSLPVGYRVTISIFLFSLFIFLVVLNKYVRFLLAAVSSAMWAYLISSGIDILIGLNDTWIWVLRIILFIIIGLFHFHPDSDEIDYIIDDIDFNLNRPQRSKKNISNKSFNSVIDYEQEFLWYKEEECYKSLYIVKNKFYADLELLKENSLYSSNIISIEANINTHLERFNQKVSNTAKHINSDKKLNREKNRLNNSIKQLEALIHDARSTVRPILEDNHILNNTEKATSYNFFKGCTTIEQCKKRYHALSRAFHPDTGNGDEEIMKKLNEEYDKKVIEFQ